MVTDVRPPLRVLVIDEHPAVRSALVAALTGAEQIGEVRAVGAPDRAACMATHWRPDVILLEIKRRDGRGLELCRTLAEVGPGTRVLVVTSYPDVLEELAALEARVAGYVLKDARPGELLNAILRVGSREANNEDTA